MAYLIEQLFGWLLIVTILCALSGWAYHSLRTSLALERLVVERDRLQRSLVNLVTSDLPADAGPLTLENERQIETLRAQLDVANARAEQLERHNRSLRDQHESDIAQMADLRAAQEAQETISLPAEPLALETGVAGTTPEQWRLRYFEARAKHLEALEAHPPRDEAALARIAELEGLLASARERAAALEAQPAAPAVSPALTNENNRLTWQVRYLEGRVKYLEAQPQAAPAPLAAVIDPQDEEEERRRGWRMGYLEARVAHLEGLRPQSRRADDLAERLAGLESALADEHEKNAALEALGAERLREAEALLAEAERERDEALPAVAKAAALEAQLATLTAQPRAAPEAGRIRWRTRYLEARIAHLEASLSSLAANRPLPPAQPIAPAVAQASPPPPKPMPAPPAPISAPISAPVVAPAAVVLGAGERPLALAAARDGAPDDLRLIEGVGPKLESTLNSLGIYHFDQIAAWTPDNIAWVDQYLRFRGRIGRERWVEQARDFAEGGVLLQRVLEEEPL